MRHYRFAEKKMKSESFVLHPLSPRFDGEKVGDDFKEADKRRRSWRMRKSKKNICGDIPLRRKMTQGVAFEDDFDVV